jgi:integrase
MLTMGVYQRGRKFGIDYYNGYRRKRELVGTSKGEAKKVLAARKAELLRNRADIAPHIDAPPFDQFVEGRYTDYARTNKRGFYNERYRLKQLTNFFRKRKLSALQRWDGEYFKTEMSRLVAPATVNRLLGNLKHILSMAVAWNILTSNPFAGVKLLKVPKRTERILTKEEERKLLVACSQVRNPHLQAGVTLALNTGMRKGEIYSLRWDQVDLPNRLIRIINGKSEKSDRHIPMNDVVFELLSNLSQRHDSEFVFPNLRKADERFRDPKVGFAKAVRLAKIPHLRFHDLRHTFATRLVGVGVDLVTVQDLLGHSTIIMTTRYAHPLADVKIAAVKRLEFAGVR